jgi:hypothetical protein
MAMTIRPSILALALAQMLAAVPVSADVQLSMRDGRVSLKATNATVREILAVWAKIGQARIINGERITGGPVTLELMNVTEGQALDVLLRSVAGYMVAPRPTAVPNASEFDRILILPTSTAPRVAAPPPSPAFPQPSFTPPASSTPPPQFIPSPQPTAGPQYTVPQPPDGEDSCGPVPPPPPLRGPMFNTFPAPSQPGAQPIGITPTRGVNVPAGASTPGPKMPVGVSVPGMVVPQPPPQPGPPQ